MVSVLLSAHTWNSFEATDHERNVANAECRATNIDKIRSERLLTGEVR
jgi:hypothetical protein